VGAATFEAVVLDCFERGDVVLRESDAPGSSEHGVQIGGRWQVAIQMRGCDLVRATGDEVPGEGLYLQAETLVGGRVTKKALLPIERLGVFFVD
jgi:hypothetical protein